MRYTVSNGFSVNHTFTQFLSGRARVAREDGEEQKERRAAWIYDAALEVTPLRTYTERLVFSGRDARRLEEGVTTPTHSYWMPNYTRA